jgi:hypothetical protein
MLLSIFLGILGGLLGFLLLLILLIISGLRLIIFSPHRRRLPTIRQPNFVYGTRVPLTWFNTLCSCLYSNLVDRNSLHAEIEKIFQTIPNEISAIRSFHLISFELSTSPPIIDQISLETSTKNNEVIFRFRYNPDLICLVSLEIPLPVLSEIQVTAHLNFTGFDGGLRLLVPPKSGAMQLRFLPSTTINCDFGVEVGSTMKVTQAYDLTTLWDSLLDWVHRYIHEKVIIIPLEEKLLRSTNSGQRTPERQSGKCGGRSPRSEKSPGKKEKGKRRFKIRRDFDLYPYTF